jgi:hypothetical protein
VIKLDNPPTDYGQMVYSILQQFLQGGRITEVVASKLIKEWFNEPVV